MDETMEVAADSSVLSAPNQSVLAMRISATFTVCPIIQNMVATAQLGVPLDLRLIAMRVLNAEYNPKRFSAAIIRTRAPRTTSLLFSTGKVVCTGAKNEVDARLAIRHIARMVKKLGQPARVESFAIHNVVASCDLKFPIRLDSLNLGYERFCQYNPEVFPGLVFRIVEPKVTVLIFVSGKLVFTGAKSVENTLLAFERIFPVLAMYRKTSMAN
jgi:transcription initiation factor TFIID TATA-box-binding protein